MSAPIRYSLNEIEHTARRAARGCGCAWGVADEVGKAMRWLHQFGLDGISGLSAVLAACDGMTSNGVDGMADGMVNRIATPAPCTAARVWRAVGGVLNPLVVGPSLGDCMAGEREVAIACVAQPLLLAGFAAFGVPAEAHVQLRWAGVVLAGNREQLALSGERDDWYRAVGNEVHCRHHPHPLRSPARGRGLGGVPLLAAPWPQLEHYAKRCYVEASAASRNTGAGAGLLDND